MLEFSQISCFVAAAEEMHFGRAAARINMTQPTLSRHIQALEHVLQVRLFDRANRTVRLTSAGRVFLPDAKRILSLTKSAANLAQRTWLGEAGVVRLGFTATAAFADLPIILARAATVIPDVKILLKEGTSAMQKDALLADMLDIALVRPPTDHGRFEVMPVRRERFVAAVHRNDPRAEKAKLTLHDFDAKNFIMYSADGAGYSYGMLTAMFDRASVAPNMVYQLDQNHSILALVSAGMGAAMVPASLTLVAFPNVVFREVVLDPPEPIEMIMLWRAQNHNPVLPTFLALCRTIFDAE